MSEKTAAQKLGLKSGMRLLAKQHPADVAALIGELPIGAELVTIGKGPYALILMFTGEYKCGLSWWWC